MSGKILLASFVFLLTFSSINAQDKNFGIGVILGEPTGLSGKYWISPERAFDAALAYSFLEDNKSFAFHANYLYLLEGVIDMHYKMPTYRYGDGWLAIANQKNYVSLYTCSADHLEKFRQRHPHIKTGKGCINFSDRDDIPVQAVKQVIAHAILHPKG